MVGSSGSDAAILDNGLRRRQSGTASRTPIAVVGTRRSGDEPELVSVVSKLSFFSLICSGCFLQRFVDLLGLPQSEH